MEQQLLPSAPLKPAYGKVAWLFSNRNFDGSPNDRLAEGIELRFGVTSYPQLLLVDPYTLKVLDSPGRTEAAFLGAVGRARIQPGDAKAAADGLRQAEERLARLDRAPTAVAAKKLLADPDVVVLYRSVEILARAEPRAVAARSGDLLKVAHDPLRYRVCEVLVRTGDRSAAAALEAVAADPKGSMNPNVLRINAVKALAACGGESSVAVVAGFAAAGDPNNGLTGVAVDALGALAARTPRARTAVRAALVQAYPSPGSGTALAQSVALAQKVHGHLTKLTGKRVLFPPVYDEAARARLMKSW